MYPVVVSRASIRAVIRCVRADLAFGGALLLVLIAAGATGSDLREDLEDGLDAREIYSRVLANRFSSGIHEFTIVSERGGRRQPMRIQLMWRRYDQESNEVKLGIVSRTLIRYLEPGDLRHTAYLVVDRLGGPDDQFLYLPSLARVRRISMRGLTIAGTDFSVEDFVPGDVDYARYFRVQNRYVGATLCFVIDAVPFEAVNSIYSKIRLYVDRDRFVPLRIRYWDEAGVEVKDMRAPVSSIRQIEGRYFTTRATMRHLQADSWTSVHMDRFAANPRLPSRYFTKKQLETRYLIVPRNFTGEMRRY